jgi:SAM-dependent methyltransferase
VAVTELVQRLFDAKAATWQDKYAPGGPLAGRLVALAEAILCYAPPGARVLDLGCGTGDLACHLARAGVRTVGCDISRPMLAGAARRDTRGGWVQLSPGWRRLPFAAAAFDAVVVSSVLEYTPDPVAALSACARVLRPGGVAVCTVPDLRHPARWLEWLARVAGRGRAGHALGQRWPRWEEYRTYLRASRQRHRARWWLAVARRAGLDPALAQRAAPLSSGGRCQALRVLVLASPCRAGGPA